MAQHDPAVDALRARLGEVSGLAPKWELLRPEIERLYFQEKLKLQRVVEIIKASYGFDAT